MNVLVVGVAGAYFGREETALVNALAMEIGSLGHRVDTLMLPYVSDMLGLPDQLLAYSLLDFSAADIVISVGYPAFTLRHSHKACFLFELAPDLHEYLGSEYGVLDGPQYVRLRDCVFEAERRCLLEADKIICGSKILAGDIKNLFGIESEVKYVPPVVDIFGECEQGDYMVCETNLQPCDNIELLIDALEICRIKTKIYAKEASNTYINALEKRISSSRLNEYVELFCEDLSSEVLACSYGYIDFGFSKRKIEYSLTKATVMGVPVLALKDGGAVCELPGVRLYENNAHSIAEGILAASKDKRRKRYDRSIQMFSSMKEIAESLVI